MDSMKKILATLVLAGFALYGGANFVAKGWYYFKVVRTVDRIMRSNGVQPQF